MTTYHLTATGNEWVLTREGTGKPIAKYRSRDRALEEAIDLAGDNAASLMIRRSDGTVAEGHPDSTGSYGLLLHPVATLPLPEVVQVPKIKRRKHRGRSKPAVPYRTAAGVH